MVAYEDVNRADSLTLDSHHCTFSCLFHFANDFGLLSWTCCGSIGRAISRIARAHAQLCTESRPVTS